MPNFTLKNPNSYATIEQTANSKENNQCGDNERPDVGDSRGNRHIVGVGDESFTRELVVYYVAFHYAIACINHLARHHVVKRRFHRDKFAVALVLCLEQALPSCAVAKQGCKGIGMIEIPDDIAYLTDVVKQIHLCHSRRHYDRIL